MPIHPLLCTTSVHKLLNLLFVCLHNRPGPEAGLSSSRLLYQMPQLRLQQPFALSVVRAGGKGTVFDTTGSRWGTFAALKS